MPGLSGRADYLTREYGSLDSDHVFVNLWSQTYGRPWTYAAVYDLVLRLRERTGIDFEPHQYRRTCATWLQMAELHLMHHSAGRVNTLCLRCSVRRYSALSVLERGAVPVTWDVGCIRCQVVPSDLVAVSDGMLDLADL